MCNFCVYIYQGAFLSAELFMQGKLINSESIE